VIGWRQSKTTGETLRKSVVVRLFAQATYGLLVGDHLALDTMNTDSNSEIMRNVEQMTLHTMAKVQDVLELWQGS
jgi:hypothetical protein